jgi:Glucodextranase, domain B/PASTA domain
MTFVKRALQLGLLTSLLALTGAGTALAQSPVTTITSPSSPTYVQNLTGSDLSLASPTTKSIEVSGTAPPSENVYLYCTWGDADASHRLFLGEAVVEEDGSFSKTVNLNTIGIVPFDEQTCVLRALPEYEPEAELQESPQDFQGPTLATGHVDEGQSGPRLPDGSSPDYLVADSQLSGYMEWDSASSCGLAFSYPYNSSFDFAGDGAIATEPLFNCAGALFAFDNATGASEISIDGHAAFTAYGALAVEQYLGSEISPAGFPSFSFHETRDPSSGDVTIEESDPLVYCSEDGSTPENPSETYNCSELIPAGVTLTRTIAQTDAGQQASVSDTFTDSTGTSHSLTLLYDDHIGRDGENFESDGNPEDLPEAPATEPAFSFGGGSFSTYPESPSGDEPEDLVTSFPAAPASIGIEGEAGQGAGGGTGDPQGAITYTTAPTQARFFYGNALLSGLGPNRDGNGPDASDLELEYERTLPASGSVVVTQVYSQSLTRSGTDELATTAADSVATPAVAITSPAAESSTPDATIAVTGTASDPVATPTLTVDGTPTTVQSNGTWTAAVTLTPGANTLTAVATNAAGRQSQAQETVDYLPVTIPPAPTTISSATIAPPCVVPALVKLTRTAAVAAITAAHCTLVPIQKAFSGTIAAGSVISQSPAANAQESNSYPVTLFVSSGPASNRFRIRKIGVAANGTLTLHVLLPDAGKLAALATTERTSAGAASRRSGGGQQSYSTLEQVRAAQAGEVVVRLHPTRASSDLLRRHRQLHEALRVRLSVQFTPTNGKLARQSRTVAVLKTGTRHRSTKH